MKIALARSGDRPERSRMQILVMMKDRPFLLQMILVGFMVVLLGMVVGCAGTVAVPPAPPVVAKAMEDPGVLWPTPAPLTTTPVPTAIATDTATSAPTPTQTSTPTPSPTSTATATPTPTPRPGLPVQLEIPAIGVDAFIEHVGLTEDLAMDVPSKVENVAWYKLGYRPGENGNAVIAGHLDTVTGAPAVFWDLELLEPGDEILVRGLDGIKRRFIVDYHTRYPYEDAPVQQIFGPADAARLVLITCNGEWDRVNRNYSHRVVVYATAAEEDQK